MSYDCYEEIVKKSLHYVACIDDEFVDAYEHSENAECVKFTKDMHQTIEQTCDCHVEILPYSKDIKKERVNKCLEDKDLLILDWELAGGNAILPLKILAQAYEMKLPFVSIYTNEPDLDNICRIIQAYFSGYSISDVEYKCEQWLDVGIIELDFKAEVLELNPLLAEKPNLKKIIDHVKELFGDDVKELEALEYKRKSAWIPLWLKWSNAILPEKRLCCASKPVDGTIIIGGMIVCCLSKPASQREEAVNIEDLIPTIAAKITEAPNSMFNLVWLHYANAVRSVLQSRSQLFSEIDDKALGYLSKELLEQGNSVYNNWMKELFRDEIMDRMDAVDTKNPLPKEIFESIKEKYKDVNPADLKEKLVVLNEKLMVNHMYSGVSHKIDFGDVFVTMTGEKDIQETYWMCVTPKCDCLRSEEKIKNNYFFIKGDRMDNYKALKSAESKYRSFIIKDEEIVSINWIPKLIIVYFEKGQNDIKGIGKEIEGTCRGEDYHYTYLCNVKENYTQRMANVSFAESNRVGITLAQIRNDNKKETQN